MRTLAAVLVELHQPLQLHSLEIPPLQVGQVLVEVLSSGICGSQLGEIAGVKGKDPYLPHLLGHEACATVLEVGPGVRKVKSGQRVVMHWRKSPGIDAEPATYSCARLGKVQSGSLTTFSRHSVVSENRLTPVADDTPPAVAALLGCAVTTGFGVVARDARLTPGESLLVLGSGGVGLSVVQAARLAGAYPIMVYDRFENRLQLARSLGADQVLLADSEGEQRLRQALPPGGFDVVVESTGAVPLIELAYQLCAPQGRVVLVGVPRVGEQARLYTLPLHFGLCLSGTHGGQSEPHLDIPRFLRLHRAGRLPLEQLISRVYPFEDINAALGDMTSGAVAGRCLLDMTLASP